LEEKKNEGKLWASFMPRKKKTSRRSRGIKKSEEKNFWCKSLKGERGVVPWGKGKKGRLAPKVSLGQM